MLEVAGDEVAQHCCPFAVFQTNLAGIRLVLELRVFFYPVVGASPPALARENLPAPSSPTGAVLTLAEDSNPATPRGRCRVAAPHLPF